MHMNTIKKQATVFFNQPQLLIQHPGVSSVFLLFFSIWSLTQHYADFDKQIRAVMGEEDPFKGAEAHLEDMVRRLLAPE